MDNTMSNAEKVLAVKKEYGLSWDALGAAVGRSGRMMRKIVRGESKGDSFMPAIEELHRTGKVTHQPPRRRNKAGKVVAVRSKTGMTVPSDTKAEVITTKRTNNRLRIHPTQHLSEGGKIDRIDMPEGKNTKGREKGWAGALSNLRRTSRSQSREDKRVKIRLTGKTSDGQIRSFSVGAKGGYHASDVLSDIRKVHGGSIEAWANSQVEAVYADSNVTIVGIEQTEFSATRSKQIRKQQDLEGTRRGIGKKAWASYL
ncbi:hypothetical protein GCM10009794_18910 [Rothia terrae]